MFLGFTLWFFLLKIRAINNEVTRLLTVEATLLIFFLGAFVTLLLRNFLFFLARNSSLLESIAIFLVGSSSESLSGDSSSDWTTFRALNDFPLDGRAIDLLFFEGSCSFRLISWTLRELTRSSTLKVFNSLASLIAVTLGLYLAGKLLSIFLTWSEAT